MSQVDDVITPLTAPIANPANREIATQIANLVIEAATHRSLVHAIYVTVCEMAGIAPGKAILTRLADEEERHIARAQINLASLRTTTAG